MLTIWCVIRWIPQRIAPLFCALWPLGHSSRKTESHNQPWYRTKHHDREQSERRRTTGIIYTAGQVPLAMTPLIGFFGVIHSSSCFFVVAFGLWCVLCIRHAGTQEIIQYFASTRTKRQKRVFLFMTMARTNITKNVTETTQHCRRHHSVWRVVLVCRAALFLTLESFLGVGPMPKTRNNEIVDTRVQ